MQFSTFFQLTIIRLSCMVMTGLLLPCLSFSQVFPKEISEISHPRAHAHNDYEHEFPLWEALHHGFMSVEADVWLIDGKLYVKHNKPKNLSQTPELHTLYIQPLQHIINKHGGRIYPKSPEPFFLMIDIKADGLETYKTLAKILKPHKELLVGVNPPLKIFLSGARPIEYAKKDKKRLVGIDGRPEDLGKGFSAAFMPVISQRYSKIVSWKGKTAISDSDFQVLKELADACHKEGKRLRLWASPETELAWETLLKAGVDLLNTDHLEKLDKFLQTRNLTD